MRLLTAIAVAAFAAAAGAADEKPAAPSGTWTKTTDGFELKYAFPKDGVVKFVMTNGTAGCKMESKYEIDKDGVIKCELVKFEKIGDFPFEKEKGYKHSMKLVVKGKKAALSDLTGDGINDEAKKLVEGEYEKAKDD